MNIDNDKIKKSEQKINKIANQLLLIKDNYKNDLEQWKKLLSKLMIESLKWAEMNFKKRKDYERYIEMDNTDENINKLSNFKYSDTVIDSTKIAIEKFNDNKGESYIKYFTKILNNNLKKEIFTTEYSTHVNYKQLLEITKLEKELGCELTSNEFAEKVTSTGILSLKTYQTLCKAKKSLTVNSLDSTINNDDGNEISVVDTLEDKKSDFHKKQNETEKICEKLLQCINFVYKTKTRKDAIERDSNIYTFFMLELLSKLTEDELANKCQKYKFINKEAVLHFMKREPLPDQKEFAIYTNKKGTDNSSRYSDKIKKLKEILKTDEELKLFYLDN